MDHRFDEIRRIKGLDLPDVVSERACAIFRPASREDLLLGWSIESMAAASVYAACWCYGSLDSSKRSVISPGSSSIESSATTGG